MKHLITTKLSATTSVADNLILISKEENIKYFL